MPDIYRHFRDTYSNHSSTNAFLLALPSYFIYPSSISWPGGFWGNLKSFMQELSDGDPFELKEFDHRGWGIDIECGVFTNSRLILVVFRGSEMNTGDWLGTNANHKWRSVPASWGGGVRVHDGFYRSLRSIYQDLRSYVRARDNTRKVFLAGHSLGGALATLCGYRFQKVGSVDVQGIYSWGAPRVGNQAFASRFAETMGGRCWRWVKGADFAAGLPDVNVVPGPGQAYIHVGQLNYINKDGSVEMDKDDFDAFGGSNADHNMKHYLYKMMKRLSNRSRRSATNPSYLVEEDVNKLVVPSRSASLSAVIAAGV